MIAEGFSKKTPTTPDHVITTCRHRLRHYDQAARTPEEAAFLETKLALSESLRTRRTAQRLSQAALAKRLKSSQSRVAKMEAADPTVSVDLLLRGLFALGATPKDVAKALRAGSSSAAA